MVTKDPTPLEFSLLDIILGLIERLGACVRNTIQFEILRPQFEPWLCYFQAVQNWTCHLNMIKGEGKVI